MRPNDHCGFMIRANHSRVTPHSNQQQASPARRRGNRTNTIASSPARASSNPSKNKPAMPRQGPRRLSAGERDRRLAEEVLYLHSLWRRGPHAPAPAPAPTPIQSRSARREELDRRALRRQERERLTLFRVLRRKERKRRRIDRAAAKPALAPPPPASSRETLAEAAGASAPSTANPPPPTTPPGPIAQREAVPSSVEFTNRDSAGDYDEGSDSDGDKAEEREAAVYFTGLFERDAWLRAHYTDRWRKGRFQCMVCAAGGGKKVGKAVRRFRGCLALVHHARDASRGRSLCGRYGRRGAHRALAAVVCRMLGWDIDKLALPRIVIDPRATAGVQHAKENDGAGENNGFSTDDDSYSIDEDEESEDEESVDEEEDIETGMPDPATDGDEEDSEIESNEEYAEKEDCENRMEDSSTDGDEDGNELERSKEAGQKEDADTGAGGSKTTDGDTEAIELDNSEKIPEKEAANSVARKRDMKIRDRLLRLTHAKPVDTTPKKTEVRKRSRVPKHKEVSIPGIKFNEGSDKAKRKASALSYQGLKSSTSGVVKKVKVNQQPSNKGKQSKTNETGASARKAKRPVVAARKAKQLAKKRKVGASTPKNTHRS